MEIEVKLDAAYPEPKVVVYAMSLLATQTKDRRSLPATPV